MAPAHPVMPRVTIAVIAVIAVIASCRSAKQEGKVPARACVWVWFLVQTAKPGTTLCTFCTVTICTCRCVGRGEGRDEDPVLGHGAPVGECHVAHTHAAVAVEPGGSRTANFSGGQVAFVGSSAAVESPRVPPPHTCGPSVAVGELTKPRQLPTCVLFTAKSRAGRL